MPKLIDCKTMEWKKLNEGIHVRTVTSNFLTAQVVKIDKGTTTIPHRHVQEQLGYVLEGRVQFVHGENGEVITVESGMFFFFAAHERHGLREVFQDTFILDIFGPAREDYGHFAVRLTE